VHCHFWREVSGIFIKKTALFKKGCSITIQSKMGSVFVTVFKDRLFIIMFIKTAVKMLYANLLSRSFSLRKKILHKGKDSCFILMYHRVTSPHLCSDHIEPGMYVTPKTFAMHLEVLSEVATILPLDKLVEHAMNNKPSASEKPFCAITFDDGWLDFYLNAFRILKNRNMSATVYLPTAFIGTHKQFWTDRFSTIWKSRRMTTITNSQNPAIKELAKLHGNFSGQVERAIRILKQLPLESINRILDDLETLFGCASRQSERSFINWEEVREMRKTGLVSFGSHTANHHILTTIQDATIRDELASSLEKLRIEEAVEESAVPFCYPNGNHNNEIAEAVRDAGYTSAVTTTHGWNTFSEHPFKLKRIGIHQDMTSTRSMFLARLAGLW
jgi:peptidoglycan/xylan/chitin deacetylase (PgdA/CDA1 family)